MDNPETISDTMEHFDLEGGWKKVPSLYAGAPSTLSDEYTQGLLRELGFSLYEVVGESNGCKLVIHRGTNGGFFIEYDNLLNFEWILVDNLPSMLEVVRKFEPFINAANSTRILEILEDLQELAKGHLGPMEDAHLSRARRRIDERNREESLAKKQASGD